MPDNNTVERAEQRVREMDRVTRQFSEQGNRYMQQMMNRRTQTGMQNSQAPVHNVPQVGRNGTRFEPVERKKSVPPKAAETQKSEEKRIPPKNNLNREKRQNTDRGIDGEKLLLIALMYLLIAENADIKLILAIAYLIL